MQQYGLQVDGCRGSADRSAAGHPAFILVQMYVAGRRLGHDVAWPPSVGENAARPRSGVPCPIKSDAIESIASGSVEIEANRLAGTEARRAKGCITEFHKGDLNHA